MTDTMREYTKGCVTPICSNINEREGALHGTGAYVSALGQTMLVTNDHNFDFRGRSCAPDDLAIMFAGSPLFYHVHNSLYAIGYPIDCALSRIAPEVWTQAGGDAPAGAAIAEAQLALAHDPVENELLFFEGYLGEGQTLAYATLPDRMAAHVTQEAPVPPEYGDERFHFALQYWGDLDAEPSADQGLPAPKGFSGSLVWNTGYTEARSRGQLWTPQDAKVTGVVWGWSSSKACLIATRIEFIRSWLMRSLEVMQASAEIRVE
ncbi:hypothetical protein [Chelatococcus reniformis]|uniref:hypothetical protein n=1 Tax=Chelatococcus reniformis TaxID=1494448 RepID=UPI001AEDC849|nr:hypothetical protein [Chelatococcus reniformis]